MTTGTFQFILGGEAIEVLDLPGRTQRKTLSRYQRLAGHAPSAGNRCVSTAKGIALLSFISFKWRGGSWCIERRWSWILEEQPTLQSHTCRLKFVWIGLATRKDLIKGGPQTGFLLRWHSRSIWTRFQGNPFLY